MGEQFAGKVVIVTGGSQGVGVGIVRAFLDEGASVVASDVGAWADTSGLQQDVGDARRVSLVSADVTSVNDWERVLGEAQRFGAAVDVLVNNLDGPPRLLINHAERLGRHWLRVKLDGRMPNPQAEGAVLELAIGGKTLVRHAHAAYSYASTNDPRVSFGLGPSATAGPLRVRWPGGGTQTVPVAAVDREMVVKQQ